jgi:hypothetical protein
MPNFYLTISPIDTLSTSTYSIYFDEVKYSNLMLSGVPQSELTGSKLVYFTGSAASATSVYVKNEDPDCCCAVKSFILPTPSPTTAAPTTAAPTTAAPTTAAPTTAAPTTAAPTTAAPTTAAPTTAAPTTAAPTTLYSILLGPEGGDAGTSGAACINYNSTRPYYSNVNFMQSGFTYIYESVTPTLVPLNTEGLWKPLSFVGNATIYAVITDSSGLITNYISCS